MDSGNYLNQLTHEEGQRRQQLKQDEYISPNVYKKKIIIIKLNVPPHFFFFLNK